MNTGIDPLFVEALVHDEQGSFWGRRILFGRVRPFSLWHEFLLASIGSPLVTGERVMPVDLLRAVRICGSVFPEARLGAVSGLDAGYLLAMWASLGRGFARELEKFEEYRADYFSVPEYFVRDDRPLEPGTLTAPPTPLGPPPEPLRVFAEVVGWSKWTRETVWNLPSGEARWYQAMALKAQRVRVSFGSAVDRDEQEALAEADPEMHARFVAAAEAMRKGG